jgi:peptidoglycan/LPS O-acetylase OafA/YrhL
VPALSSLGKRSGYVPALDGYRGIGIVATMLYHHGAVWAQGSIFAISTFFTLSGFLITTLLIHERAGTGRVDLWQFWVRRFRRLLPAALVTLAGVVVFGATFADATQLGRMRGDVTAALGYVANWRFIASGQAYLDHYSTPSPVLHFWSLAIEEQFYVCFPLIVAVVLWRARPDSIRRRLGLVLGGLAVASAALPLVTSMGPDRIYLGTDTRAAEILAGCVLAVLLSHRRMGDPVAPGVVRSVLRVLGPVALVGAIVIWVVVPKTAGWIYSGGFPAYAIGSCVLIAACLDAGNLVTIVLRRPTLVWLGQRSYSLYLLHFPLFMVLSPERTGLSFWPLLAVRVLLTVIASELLHRFVEEPLRRGRRVLAQPLIRVAPAFGGVVVVALLAVTSGAGGGTVQLASAGGDRLQLEAAVRDTTPPVPVDRAARSVAPTSAAPTTAPAATSTTAAPRSGPLQPPPVRRPDRRLRMLVVGDSSAVFLAHALDLWDDAGPKLFDVAGYGLMGCGLVTGGTENIAGKEIDFDPKCEQWEQIWRDAITETRPDMIVLAGSFHDATDRRLTADGRWEHVGQDRYDAVLREAYLRVLDVLGAAGVPILWLDNPPVMQGLNLPDRTVPTPANDPHRMVLVNRIQAEVAAGRPNVAVVPYASFYEAWPGGALDPVLRGDGLHVDYEGRELVSRWLGPTLLDTYWRVLGL